MKVTIYTNTNGKGKNTEEQRLVIINHIRLGRTSLTYFPEEPFAGELRAFFEPHGFTTGSWNVEGFGLICGDRQWLKEFKAGMRELGFSIKAVQNIKYEEKSMHGNDFVSLAIGPNFYASWKRMEAKLAKEEEARTFVENV